MSDNASDKIPKEPLTPKLGQNMYLPNMRCGKSEHVSQDTGDIGKRIKLICCLWDEQNIKKKLSEAAPMYELYFEY